ncbi:MAG: diguanylate cyclase and serine/threonine protein kinase with repeat, partial [Thermomicrobiales bacterium]|nr:diguanylate cyclase and serine/threonine protein kinase with repeat [Thermomicrobiales bacterium]
MSDPVADDGDVRASAAIPGTGDVSGLVSVKNAAALLGVHERTLRRAIARGDLPAIKEGRRFHIALEALDRYRAGRGGGADEAPLMVRQGATLIPFPGGTRLPAILPAPPMTRFIGRADELQAARRLLQEPVRLVTMVGPGGIGKTRLALELATAIRDDFADGAVFVSMAAFRTADLVMPAIATSLGVRLGAAQSALERVVAFLRNRDMLLVLDNLEQVTDAAAALSELVAACPRLKMLATSRAPLRIAGEHLFAVPPLALPRDQPATIRPVSLDALATVEAVALFVDRARAASPGFAMTAANAPVIAAICERTDGVPLAIELAAARTSVLSLADLRDRMSHQLAILRGGPRDQPPRLRSMADAIGWSYNLLSSDERALFRRLAIFVGGVALDAAEAVGGDDALDSLAALVDQSLLQRVAGPNGATRYAMLETVREYGVQRLAESEEEPAVRDAHADWCIALAEQADPELSGPDQARWFDRLEAEHPNMRAALTWLLDREDAARGVRLATALSWFWSSRGYLREAHGWMQGFLDLPGGVSPSARAMGLREAANIAHWQGDLDSAARLAAESLAVLREHGDPAQVAAGLRGLGSIAIDQRRLDEGAAVLAESRELLQSSGVPWDAAFAVYLWGRHAAAGGRYAEAAERFAEAAAAFREVGDRAYAAGSLGRLGAALLRLGDRASAKSAYTDSLRQAHEMHEPIWVAWALLGAAEMASSEARLELGARLLGAAQAICEETGAHRDWDDQAPELGTLMGERYAAARARGA